MCFSLGRARGCFLIWFEALLVDCPLLVSHGCLVAPFVCDCNCRLLCCFVVAAAVVVAVAVTGVVAVAVAVAVVVLVAAAVGVGVAGWLLACVRA